MQPYHKVKRTSKATVTHRQTHLWFPGILQCIDECQPKAFKLVRADSKTENTI